MTRPIPKDLDSSIPVPPPCQSVGPRVPSQPRRPAAVALFVTAAFIGLNGRAASAQTTGNAPVSARTSPTQAAPTVGEALAGAEPGPAPGEPAPGEPAPGEPAPGKPGLSITGKTSGAPGNPAPKLARSSGPPSATADDAPRQAATTAAAQKPAPTADAGGDIGWSALPVGTYSPETQLGLGAFGALLFRLGDEDAQSRASNVAAVGLLTTREQAIFELLTELYWDQEAYRLWAKLDYRYYPNSFWGIGSDTPDSQRELYLENGPRLQVQFRRIVYRKLYLELRLDTQFSKVQDQHPGGLLDSRAVVGSHGKRAIGIGPTVGWDSRDHSLDPHTGGFYEVSLLQFHKGLFSDTTFTRLELNFRRYLRLAEGHTLAAQLYGEFAFGTVPFYRLPLVGGQRTLRGYFEGRYRDRALLAAQVEYRAHIFWRLGGVLFAGAGDVGPSLADIPFAPVKWSVGCGARLRLNEDERLNLRADLGLGHGTYGIYVGIAEAF